MTDEEKENNKYLKFEKKKTDEELNSKIKRKNKTTKR
jgi:hypothetical protein